MRNAVMDETIREKLAEPKDRLKWAREQANYAQASDAARAMGVKVATYIAHENGSRKLTRSADRYARFFRVSMEWLLTGRGAPKGPPRVQQIFDNLAPDLQKEAINYLEFLNDKNKNSHSRDALSNGNVEPVPAS